MLKKMRRRVITAAMLAFAAVILLIGILVNVSYYIVTSNRQDMTIDYILKREKRPHEKPAGPDKKDLPKEPFMELPDIESNYMTRFFIVRTDDEGGIISVSTDNIASIDEEEAASYAKAALGKSSAKGYVKSYRFSKQMISGENVLIFLNSAKELESVNSLFILTVIISLSSLILVFILVVIFSGKAIKPIADNIRLQKQFITDAGHELKTPVTSISTSNDVIEMEHGKSEWTENIRRQANRMSHLVSELVTLSKLDEDTPLPEKELFSLTGAAWEIVEVYNSRANATGRSMICDIPEEISIKGDKNALQQMFSVLLDNALRYSDPNGTIRFTVKKKRSRIIVEVFNTCDLDTIPDTKRLFDRFYRPDSSRNSENGGTGIGLSIARAVAEAHGGTIRAICPDGKSMTIEVII